jgi:transcription antitermination factor NusA-like protein
LTHADVDGAIKITKLAERNQDVTKFTMTGASRVDKDFILALSGSDISAIRANSALSKKFEDEFQCKVWFVEGEATDKRFIENLYFPAKVRAVNMVWLPDGSKLTKAIISTSNKFESQPDIEKIKQIAKEIRNIELLVEFEHEK